MRRNTSLRLLLGAFAAAIVVVAALAQGLGPNPGTPGSGTVTSVACGAGLSGGTIVVSGTCAVAAAAAWSAYTPTVTCGSGTITTKTVSGRQRALGKTVFVEASVNITSLGTCAGNLSVTLPTGVVAQIPLSGLDATTPAVVPAQADVGSGAAILAFAVGPAAEHYYIGGLYESP